MGFKTLTKTKTPESANDGFRTWLEKVEIPPHMPHIFWRGVMEQAGDIEARLLPLKDIERIERELDEEEFVDMRLSRDFPHKIAAMLRGDGYEKMLSDKIRDMRDSADFARTNPEDYWGEYGVVARLDVFGDSKKAATHYARAYADFFLKKKKYNNYGEIERAEVEPEVRMKILKLKSAYDAVFDYTRLLKKVGRAARATMAHRAHRVKALYSGGDESKIVPQTGRVEVLHHATPYVKEILKDGFKTKENLGGRESLGGATDGGISFTADLNVAREIAKCIKEVIGIAKGKIKVNDVLKMISSERTKGEIPWALKDYINAAKSRQWKWNSKPARDLSKQTGIPLAGKPYELNDKKTAFDLYRRYLAWSDKRYDPLFFGVNIDGFGMMDEANVGVVSAKVDMTKVMSYHSAMEEYRSPLDAILSVAAPRSMRPSADQALIRSPSPSTIAK